MEQTNTAGTVSPHKGVKGLSYKGLYQVFFQPSEFFAQLKSQPKVLVPYVATALVFLLAFWLIGDLTVEFAKQQAQFQQQPVPDNILYYLSIFQPVLAFLIYPLMVSALAMLVGSFMLGERASFKQVLSVALYGTFICAVGTLVVVPMMLAKGSVLVSLSLGVLAPEADPGNWLYMLLTKIELFNIWEIIAAGIGFSAVYNLPRNKGYLISVLSIGLLSAIAVILGSLFG